MRRVKVGCGRLLRIERKERGRHGGGGGGEYPKSNFRKKEPKNRGFLTDGCYARAHAGSTEDRRVGVEDCGAV